MNNRCANCRFLDGEYCTVGICGVVRSDLRGMGITIPPAERLVLTPEPITPEGVTALRVDTKEFPPTAEGYIAARAYQGANPQAGELEPVRKRVTA